MLILFSSVHSLAGSVPPHADVNLDFILIHFDTTTYDQIERDKKITLEGQLGLIGGTMGLLTGFSILSGVEILYYLAKFFIALWLKKTCCQKRK